MPDPANQPQPGNVLSSVQNQFAQIAAKITVQKDKQAKFKKPPFLIPYHFRLYMGDDPQPHISVAWEAEELDNWYWVPRTNQEGWGVLGKSSPDDPDPNRLVLKAEHNGKWLVIKKITLPGPDEQRKFTGEHRIWIAITLGRPPVERIPDPDLQRNRYDLGIAGEPQQVEELVPMIEKRTCLRVKKVFLEDRHKSKKLSLPKRVKILPVSKGMDKELDSLQVLLDLNGSSRIRKLYKDKILGRSKTKVIILPQGETILKYLDDLVGEIEPGGGK